MNITVSKDKITPENDYFKQKMLFSSLDNYHNFVNSIKVARAAFCLAKRYVRFNTPLDRKLDEIKNLIDEIEIED